MTVRVRLFALARDAAGGVDRIDLSLPDTATVSDAITALEVRFAGLSALALRLATAVNLEYVQRDHVLRDGDELALIPPVSGG